MTKRLQVLLDDAEMREIRQLARSQRVTVAEWVRQVLRAGRRAVPRGDAARKLATVRAAARHAFPAPDIDRMLAEIEQGYGARGPALIFVDSNIPMYVIGAEHPHKAASRLLLEQAIAQGERLVTDAEVLQEILHRYAAIDRRDAIQPAFEALLGVVDEVFPVERQDAERARDLLHATRTLSARDALHVAIMQRHGVAAILSFDSGFDPVPGISRLS